MGDSITTTRGVDDYHGDGRVNWKAVAAEGFGFAIHKATQGVAETDPAFAYNWVASRASRLVRGAYHYFDASADPVAQARHFCHSVPYQKGDLRLALDVEEPATDIVERTEAAIAVIKSLTGVHPFLYASRAFYQDHLASITSCPLWIAEYGVEKPGITCAIWQHTERGKVTGVTHPFDLDTYFGSLDDLSQRHTFS